MRIFSETERRQMTRKPGALSEVGGVAMSDARLADLQSKCHTIRYYCGAEDLNHAIEVARAEGITDVEFLAVNAIGKIYAVNTEGYNYARYVGQIR